MRAAVVSSLDVPPRCASHPEPEPRPPDELVVDVVGAGLHPRVRSQANGTHYTTTPALPFVPGIDGVGRDGDGRLRYFILGETALGSMAERTVVDVRRSVVLPDDSDALAVAAAMNPAMSSWIALRRRTTFRAGQRVLVLGATGNAGTMAVQIATHLGASEVVAAGRDAARLASLAELGASHTVQLVDGDDAPYRRLGAVASDVDVVVDYLWGHPAAAAMAAVVTARTDRSRPLTWIEVGSVAGPTAAIPSAALRAARLEIVGSGQGSVAARDIVEELPALAAEITRGTFRIDLQAVPLEQVDAAWREATGPSSGRARIVIVP
jgi:NADPH:quinone reductase-like Zn-dependent oxidoreductase